MAEGSSDDLLIAALDNERQRFVAACLNEELPAAIEAWRQSKAIMDEHLANMRSDIEMLRKRVRLRKEGR